MKILGRNFVFGRTIDEALKRAAPERRQGLEPQLRHARRGRARTFDDAERYASLCAARSTASPSEAEGGFRKLAGHLGQAVGAPSALRVEPRRRGQGRDPAGASRAGAQGVEGRRPFHHRRRGSRPARAADRPDRGAARRRRACSPTAGAASGSPSRPIRSAPCPCATGSSSWPGARPQAHGPPGQGRLLGHGDQGRAGRGACPTIRCSPARSRPTSPISPAPSACSPPATHLSGLRDPQRQHHRAR